MTVDDVVGAAFLPTDGQANPSDITQALAKGARMAGVTLREGVAVTGFELELGTLKAVIDRAGPDRVREGRALRRAVDPRLGRAGRGQRAAGLGAAPVHRHRADRRA